MINTRDYYLRRAKRTNSEHDWSTYKRLRNNVTNSIRHAKSNYIWQLFREHLDTPRDFWKLIKKCYPVKEKGKASKTFVINGNTISNEIIISNSFCSYFATIGSSLANKISSLTNFTWGPVDCRKSLSKVNKHNSTFKFQPVRHRDDLKILQSLKSSKAAGVDNIPASLIKDGAEELATPISLLVDRSFQEGTFPTVEKSAKMTPLYKSGVRSSLDNYRPISVLNILSKVVERIAYMQIMEYLEENNLLSPYQYGFRRHRSTQHAVIKFLDHIREHMDKRQLTGALFMDFRKAFDTVNHARLLHKLPFYGILDN